MGKLQEIYYLVDSLNLQLDTSINNGTLLPSNNFSNFNIELISPNGDGKNDFLDFKAYNLTHLNLQVFNRWGNTVFVSKDINTKWQGQNQNNQPLPSSTYYYLIEATQNNETIIKKGFIQLIY